VKKHPKPLLFMPSVIRAGEHPRGVSPPAFNFVDLSAQAQRYLAKIRAEADQIIAQAWQEGETIRCRAEAEGRQAGLQTIEDLVRQQLATAFPAVQHVIQEIENSRHAWLRHWEAGAVRMATAMAERVIRREVGRQPEITLTLVREALELAAGNARLRLHLHPEDCQALGNQVQLVIDELAPLGGVEIVPDTDITLGSCRLETQFGTIDEQFDAQLKRIEEELMQ
jgi:flagellar assembly protein FliH